MQMPQRIRNDKLHAWYGKLRIAVILGKDAMKTQVDHEQTRTMQYRWLLCEYFIDRNINIYYLLVRGKYPQFLLCNKYLAIRSTLASAKHFKYSIYKYKFL